MTSIEDTDQSSLEMLITKTIRKELHNFFKRRLIFWTLRWAAVFLVIRMIINSYPKVDWLWWIGGVGATISLIITITSDLASIKKDKQAICLVDTADDNNT